MKQRASYNSILLAGARLFSTASSLLISMILTKTLDLSANGIYAQCLTIISVGLSIISLGLMDGGNYFFAKARCKQERHEYINAILFLVYLCGLIVAGVLILFRAPISRYFSTPALENLLILVACRPMLSSLINVLNVLYIATNRAKTVVIRNAAISFVHLVIVIVTAVTTKDVGMILALYLVAEILTDGFMLYSFGKAGYSVQLHLPRRTVLYNILQYCLPMAAYIAMNSLLRDTDKLIIGWHESTEMQAIYSNCAKILPIDVVSSAFYTILVPKITQHLTRQQFGNARNIFLNYLKIGLLSTGTFATAISLCPDQAICFLYSSDYLYGRNIFVLYNVVEFLKFSNVTIVLSAVEKTKTLMIVSAIMLAANLFISMALYEGMGFSGPAIGTVIITGVTVMILLTLSARNLKVAFIKLIDIRFLLGYILKAAVSAAVCLLLKRLLLNMGAHQFIILFSVCGLYCLLMLLCNFREIKNCLSRVDQVSEEHLCAK